MEIREIAADERASASLPVQAYAFSATPVSAPLADRLARNGRFYAGNLTLVAEEDGVPVADASAIPMRQNVRGTVYPMAGVAGVATLPQARRRGYARALVTGLLDRMRDSGHPVAALYPFRPSFYERFGFAGLPAARTVTFPPQAFAGLLRADLPGEVTLASAADGYQDYVAVTERVLARRHGFAVLPDFRMAQLREDDDRWIVTARAGGELVAALTYRITGFGGLLAADDLLAVSPLGRALLLQFVARHTDQVAQAEVRVAADELPELWATDLPAVSRAEISFPAASAPMARVLSLPSLAGLRAGPARVAVEVTGDRYLAGGYRLDGRSGTLEVSPGDGGSAAAATLTAAGLSALVYGVLDPDEVVIRGLGAIPADAAAALRLLFPRQVPYLYAGF
jgi:predicted acetyltransferase